MKKSFCFTLMILFLAACGNSQPQQEESGASHQTMVISRSDIALEQTSGYVLCLESVISLA